MIGEVVVTNGDGPIVEPQSRSTAAQWSEAPGDLRSLDLFVPAVNGTVKLRGLSVGQVSRMYSRVTSHAKGKPPVDVERLNILKFHEGVVEPRFTIGEVESIIQKFGPTFIMVVEAIDDLTNEDPDAEAIQARFREDRGTG